MLGNLDVYSRTITVSGFPPITATAVYVDGVMVITVQSGAFDIQSTYATGVAKPMVYSRTVWCAKCRRLVPGASAMDGRLGFRGYCNSCVQELAGRCMQKFAKLPISGVEFYCCTCTDGGQIKPLAALCPPERDGRRRLRCRECRVGQLRAARLKRRKRQGIP